MSTNNNTTPLLRLGNLLYLSLGLRAPAPRRKKRSPNQYRQEQLDKKTFLTQLRKDLVALYGVLETLGDEAQVTSGSSVRAFKKLAEENNQVQSWLTKYNLTGDLKDKLLGRLTDFALGKKKKSETYSALVRFLEPAFVERARGVAQRPMHEVGITPEIIRRILPPSFVFEVAPDNTIVHEFSVFGNKLNTTARKSKAMAQLLTNWNKMAVRLTEDVDSEDPVTRLHALVASIVVSTGIRPGTEGMGKLKTLEGTIIRDDEGKPIKLETVGATGLRLEHIQFVRNDFVRLEFPGKSGTINIAELSNPNLIKALRKQIQSVQKNDPEGLAFVTEDGRAVTTNSLNKYFRSIVGKEISSSDFRKLRATQTFYNNLRDGKKYLAEKLALLKLDAVESMKEQIVEVVLNHLEEAAAAAQQTLSHENLETTIGNYISPRVVLHYLTAAGIEMALEKVVGDGRNIQVRFDPIDFYNKVRSSDMPEIKAALFEVVGSTIFQFGEPFTELLVDETIDQLGGLEQ